MSAAPHRPASLGNPVYRFQGCEIDLGRRELRAQGEIRRLGGRAFEIAEILVRADGDLVTKDALMSRVWPGAVVEENTLQVHVAALRRALGVKRTLLKTEQGRGYRLSGPWIRRDPAPPAAEERIVPLQAPALVGRAETMRMLCDLLSGGRRLVTLTGVGGIGKTLLALHVAERLKTEFADIVFVPLAPLADAGLVPAAMAGVLGLQLGGEVSAQSLARAIGTRRLLLLLDNCEHVIEAAARVADAVGRLCPHVAMLATSREALRSSDEFVVSVPALALPPAASSDPAELLAYPAMQVFVARVEALGADPAVLRDRLPLASAICRRLDGIPLALEFAAARAVLIGLPELAVRLNNRFRFLTNGHRFAVQRHQTLQAMLDWSYELLSAAEKRLFRAVSLFPDGFMLAAAEAVFGGEALDGIESLVRKSLLTLDPAGPRSRWRMLETVRLHGAEKLAGAGERDAAMRRAASYLRSTLARSLPGVAHRLRPDELALACREIDALRCVLDWCFSSPGDAALGVDLTAAGIPLLLHLSLMREGRDWIERALASEGAPAPGSTAELQLNVALTVVLIHVNGSPGSIRRVLARSLRIAEAAQDATVQMDAFWAAWTCHANRGDYRTAIVFARSLRELAGRSGQQARVLLADRVLGTTLHYLGDQHAARSCLERMLRDCERVDPRDMISMQYDLQAVATASLARVLCLQGLADEANAAACASLERAAASGRELTLCYVLAEAVCPVALMTGDLARSQEAVRRLMATAPRFNFVFWSNVGQCLAGMVMIHQGQFRAGAGLLDQALVLLAQTGRSTHQSAAAACLARALASMGRTAEALACLDNALVQTARSGERWCRPQLLRQRGELSLSGAEGFFARSAALAERQGAALWMGRPGSSA